MTVRWIFAVISSLLVFGTISAEEHRPYSPVDPFAGRVTGNKVRMRIQPDLGAQIVKELNDENLLIVVGEQDDFYAISAPEGLKAYVYRPFVLDNVIEGTHVNVRMFPDVDAPIMTQLNTGDRVRGHICDSNSKWMEIDLPASACFYVAKEFVDKVGGPDLVHNRSQRSSEVGHLLNSAYLLSQSEMRKPFHEIDFDKVAASFKRVINEYPDFRSHTHKAEAMLALTEEIYLQKKLAGVGDVASKAKVSWDQQQDELTEQLARCEEKLWGFQEELGIEVDEVDVAFSDTVSAGDSIIDEVDEVISTAIVPMTDKMRSWEPVEESLYHLWAMQHPDESRARFYREQAVDAIALSGIIEAYDRPVQNRPGDYVLRANNRPIAYLYSTQVALEDKVGQRVTVKCAKRPNHHFAYPAYFVLSTD